MQLSDEVVKRFKTKFTKALGDNCWEWNHKGPKERYGVMKVRGKNIKAHRLSFLIYKGDFSTAS